VLDVFERKGRNRHVLTALARQPGMDVGALADAARLREIVAAADAYLRVAAPEVTPVSFSYEEDKEHACQTLVAATRANGSAHRNVIDHELVASPEFEEARRLARELAGAGAPPFALGEGETAEALPNLQQAVARVMAQARKGLEIQRYKGLGEMNPTQLWETTMSPDTRTLLQVKIEDAYEADDIFSTLMGDEVEPRRKFIEANALNVRNLDI
jgi:DNA gyrase subunit B